MSNVVSTKYPAVVSPDGHYESRFFRGNHPTLPLAFWIRHTIRIPRGAPDAATGELWAITFDGLTHRVTAIKQSWPLRACVWGARTATWVIGGSRLESFDSDGGAKQGDDAVEWNLRWRAIAPAGASAMALLPSMLYSARSPTPKTYTLAPLVEFSGHVMVNHERIDVDGWRGSDNHNWGRRHADEYVWAQVCGFDNDPEATFEGICSRPRVAGFWGPTFAFLNLRCQGQEFAVRGIVRALRVNNEGTAASWRFEGRARGGARITGVVEADPTMMARLRYESPCGAIQACGNSKLARCEITVHRRGKPDMVLKTAHRAALEVLERAELTNR